MLKEGMYVRVSVDYEDDINPRMFATGQIEDVDQFGNIKVVFHKEFRSKDEEVIYSYIPDSKVYPSSKVQRCKILKKTKGIYDLFNTFSIIKYKNKSEEGYYRYYVETSTGIEIISEDEMIVDFTRGEINPFFQMDSYEFHSPFWYGQRLLPSEINNILNNLDKNFKTLISSRAYLFEHQIDTIVRALKEDKIRLMFADEVGLGKTIEALVVLKGMNLKNALIIVPDSLINQWKNEIYVKLWMESTIYEGDSLPKKGIVLIPFEKLNQINLDEIISYCDFCIIDEVHRCLLDKELFYNLHRICKKISQVILLSATPIQERKEEYLKLLQLLKPDIYDEMNTDEFCERYEKSRAIRKTVYGIIRDLDDIDEDLAEEMQEDLIDVYNTLEDKRLAKIVDEIDPEEENYGEEKIREALAYISENYQFEKSIIRHRRKEIQDEMPERVLEKIAYEMKAGDENFYEYNTYEKVFEYTEYLLKNTYEKDGESKYVIELINSMFSSPWALEAVLLNRINCIKNDIEEEFISSIRIEMNKWKEACQSEINNISELIEKPDKLKGRFSLISDYIDQELYDKKVVIFTSYPQTLIKLKEVLARLLGEEAISTFSLLNNREELEENVIKFQNNEECKIMICDESGGEGRNFQIADCIIHFDIPFSPTLLEQRIGRLDRIGRDKNKEVLNIVIFTEDTLENDLFNLWNDGLNIFTESLSGLEIALESINNYILNAISSDLKFGLNYILEEIKKNLKEIREAVKEERYFDMARQLDSKTKDRYDSIIRMFDSKGGEILAESMLKWCRAVGFSPVEVIDGNIIKFEQGSINYICMSHTMFCIPDTIETLKRRDSPGITGTFDRTVAVNKENIAFFAPGEKIFDSIMQNVEEGYRGRCAAIEVNGSEVEWEGFIIRWNVEFNVIPLIEEGFGLNYKVFSNGYMPLNQIITFIPLNEGEYLKGDEEQYILEFLKENYRKSVVKHLGERKGTTLKSFKMKYDKYIWKDIIKSVSIKSKKLAIEKYKYLLRGKELQKDLSMILAGARASKRYFNNKELDCDELKKGLEKVIEGVNKPDISVDSILYINSKRI